MAKWNWRTLKVIVAISVLDSILWRIRKPYATQRERVWCLQKPEIFQGNDPSKCILNKLILLMPLFIPLSRSLHLRAQASSDARVRCSFHSSHASIGPSSSCQWRNFKFRAPAGYQKWTPNPPAEPYISWKWTPGPLGPFLPPPPSAASCRPRGPI